MTAEGDPNTSRESLADLLSRLRTPSAGTSRALQDAADKTAHTGRSLAELLSALKPPTVPPLVVPDVQTALKQIDLAQMPEARTARATEEIADLLIDYQADVAALVDAMQAQTDGQRARADRAEARERKMHRLAQISAAAAVLALFATLVGLVVGLGV